MADDKAVRAVSRRAGAGQDRAGDRRGGSDRRAADPGLVPSECAGELDPRVREVVEAWQVYCRSHDELRLYTCDRYSRLFLRLNVEQRRAFDVAVSKILRPVSR